MAFFKYADAIVEKSEIDRKKWDSAKQDIVGQGNSEGFVKNASVDLNEYPPEDYLLTHCTIIASVDVDEVPNVKTGENIKTSNGQTIDRPYDDYYITPETSKYINQNGDAWERELLLSCFETFIGAENYVEHIQMPEMSKGKVIDAVARDLNDTVYVDILVATNRKHGQLISDIESGKVNTLSMGCFPEGTPVTMSDGSSKSIEKISPGDRVYTHTGESKKVKNVQKRMWHRDLIQIETPHSSDPLVATDNHPFLTVRPQKKCACGCGEDVNFRDAESKQKRLRGRFKVGHDKRILNPNANYDEEERQQRESEINSIDTEWVEAGDLEENDWLVFPESKVTKSPDGITQKDARLMGYYLAEGNVCKNPDGEIYAVEFTFGAHEEDTLVSEVCQILDEKGLEYSVYNRSDRNTSSVRIHEPEYAEFLMDVCGHYADEKQINVDDLLLWPSEYKKALVGAYVNGDGTVNEQGCISAMTVFYQLHQQIRRLLGSLGINTSEWCKTVDSDVSLHEAYKVGRQENNRLPSFKVVVSESQRYHLKEHTKWDTPTDQRQWEQNTVDGLVLMPVREITQVPCEEDFVYDFEVEDDHSYVVDGYAVHNCSIQYSICTKCGNVAADETDLCQHVKYQKGNTFIDGQGNERKVAELCGHRSDPDSVKFIEASWVAEPAFKGAVLQSILNSDTDISQEERQQNTNRQQQLMGQSSMLSEFMASQNIDQALRSASVSPDDIEKALQDIQNENVRRVVASSFGLDQIKDAFGGGGGFDDEEEEEDGGEDESKIDKIKEELKGEIHEETAKELVKELKDELGVTQKEPLFDRVPQMESLNDTIVESYQAFSDKYASEFNKKGLKDIFKVVFTARQTGWSKVANMQSVSNRHIVAALYLKDRDFRGNPLPNELYECLMKVGGTSNYNNLQAFLNACFLSLNRKVTKKEAKILINRGNILK